MALSTILLLHGNLRHLSRKQFWTVIASYSPNDGLLQVKLGMYLSSCLLPCSAHTLDIDYFLYSGLGIALQVDTDCLLNADMTAMVDLGVGLTPSLYSDTSYGSSASSLSARSDIDTPEALTDDAPSIYSDDDVDIISQKTETSEARRRGGRRRRTRLCEEEDENKSGFIVSPPSTSDVATAMCRLFEG